MAHYDHEGLTDYLDGLDYIDRWEFQGGRIVVFRPETDSHMGDALIDRIRDFGYRVHDVNFRDNGVVFAPRRDR